MRRWRVATPCCARLRRRQNRQAQPGGAVIASEAKQSIEPHNRTMDCFVASLLAMTEVLNGKVHRLQQPLAALSAAWPAARHYCCLLLLAGEPGDLAILPARGRLRPLLRVHRP